MAEAFFKKYSKGDEVKSAGIEAGKYEGREVGEIDDRFVKGMKEEGIDISGQKSKQLTKKMIDWADKIVVIAKKEIWPDYLRDSEKVEFWNIGDPAGGDLNQAIKAKDEIKIKVEELVEV
jgi:protein-tyrosine-phosphatase